jgi:hypothetical protein
LLLHTIRLDSDTILMLKQTKLKDSNLFN